MMRIQMTKNTSNQINANNENNADYELNKEILHEVELQIVNNVSNDNGVRINNPSELKNGVPNRRTQSQREQKANMKSKNQKRN